MQNHFEQFRQQCSTRVEQALSTYLNIEPCPSQRCLEAMRYATLNGGKRVRPLLVYAAAQAMGLSLSKNSANNQCLDAVACAIEMIHAYSLVHDDLPAMDDDDLRRGKPTLHIAFDEATAILAGDALQTRAFEIIASDINISPQTQLKTIQLLTHASGLEGMVGGQMQDLLATDNQSIDLHQLTAIHRLKTGALIKASLLVGALVAEKNDQHQMDAIENYANHLGLAFQIRDDILDVVGDTDIMGKQQGHDVEDNKTTYVSLLGIENARQHLQQQCRLALDAIQTLDNKADQLRQLVDFIAVRNT